MSSLPDFEGRSGDMLRSLATFSQGFGWFAGGAITCADAAAVLAITIRGKKFQAKGWLTGMACLASLLQIVGVMRCVVGRSHAGWNPAIPCPF